MYAFTFKLNCNNTTIFFFSRINICIYYLVFQIFTPMTITKEYFSNTNL